MSKTILFLLLLIFSHSVIAQDKVYIIHGFASNKLMMQGINKSLRKQGFRTKNYGYRSLKKDLNQLGLELYQEIAASGETHISFVTHSMGALVLRSMYQHIDSSAKFPQVHRIVMLAPPNQGAEIADFYGSSKFLRWMLGPNLGHLKTDTSSYANQLPLPEGAEIGIVVGVGKRRLWYNHAVKAPNDGYLTSERTRLGIEKERIELDIQHNAMLRKKQVKTLIINFLKNGCFGQP